MLRLLAISMLVTATAAPALAGTTPGLTVASQPNACDASAQTGRGPDKRIRTNDKLQPNSSRPPPRSIFCPPTASRPV